MSDPNSPAPPPSTDPTEEPPTPEPDPTSTGEEPTDGTTTTQDPTGGTTSEPTPEPEPEPTPTSSEEDPTTSTTTTEEESTTSTSEEPTSTTPEPETTTESTTTTEEESTTSTTSSEEETTTSEESTTSTTVERTTFETTTTDNGTTKVVTVTNTRTEEALPETTSIDPTGTAVPIDPSGDGGGGLPEGGKVAIGVVVPIVAIAIIAIVGLFFWKKRKARLAAEEERRKEVEDYSYNPNADPTYPPMGGVMAGEGGYEMREDGSSGYRGWGTTLAGSTGRKASTTMSGGGMGAYSDATSPTQVNASLARADEPHSPEGEILGAMGPSANNNRGTGVDRGPSNASSSYSAAGRSEGSDGAMGVGYGGGANYYEQQHGNPYSDHPYGTSEMPAQPVIRDNPARRNTRIENPSHYPQQSAGISQNF